MAHLPERISEKLESIANEMAGEIEVVQNVRIILDILCRHYDTQLWVIQELCLSLWESDCVVFQWENKEGLFMFVYAKYVSIDITILDSSDNFTHNDTVLLFCDEKDLSDRFYEAFDKCCIKKKY
jgi:hypothetical protein